MSWIQWQGETWPSTDEQAELRLYLWPPDAGSPRPSWRLELFHLFRPAGLPRPARRPRQSRALCRHRAQSARHHAGAFCRRAGLPPALRAPRPGRGRPVVFRRAINYDGELQKPEIKWSLRRTPVANQIVPMPGWASDVHFSTGASIYEKQ